MFVSNKVCSDNEVYYRVSLLDLAERDLQSERVTPRHGVRESRPEVDKSWDAYGAGFMP